MITKLPISDLQKLLIFLESDGSQIFFNVLRSMREVYVNDLIRCDALDRENRAKVKQIDSLINLPVDVRKNIEQAQKLSNQESR